MKSLIIDTSQKTSYIILTQNEEILFFKKFLSSNLSQELYPSIISLLKESKTDLSKLKYIATSVGPGSFTGLRVSATVCKTINYTQKIPLICYYSLQAYLPQSNGKFLSVFDAKSEGIYLQEAKVDKDKALYKEKPKLLSLNDAKKLFDKYPTIISPDYKELLDKFPEHKEKLLLATFDPLNVISITEKLYENKIFNNHQTLSLLYLRGPDHLQ